MNAQEILNTAYLGVAKQGKRAVTIAPHNDGETCRYRTDDGLKCAFGMLIPDELYNPILENITAESILNPTFDSYSTELGRTLTKEEEEQFFRPISDLYGEHADLIGALQSAHDYTVKKLMNLHGLSFQDAWFDVVEEVAYLYDLVMPEMYNG